VEVITLRAALRKNRVHWARHHVREITMSLKRFALRRIPAALATTVAVALLPNSLHAAEYNLFGTPVNIGNLFTIGGLVRMQERDGSNIGKSNLARLQGLDPLCVGREGDDGVSGPGPRGSNTFFGNTCNPAEITDGRNANQVFVEAPGSFSPNADNGNLNFDKHDIVHAAAKLTTDISFSVFDANVFIRTLALFDSEYNDLEEFHPDTTLIARGTSFSKEGKDVIARELKFLDFFISRGFAFGDQFVNVKLGRQVLNWGESGFLLANSLNAINPADQALLRVPGFDLKELQKPLGMLTINTEVAGVNVEAFYGYEWEPVGVDPVGSFFSQSDTLGPGGEFAMLSFSKAPEDPGAPYTPTGPDDPFQGSVRGLYSPSQNPDDPAFLLNSQSSRTLFRDKAAERARLPSDTGQYGLALRYFAEGLNCGTEFGAYFANYHARVPSVSGFAAAATCLPDSVTPAPGVGLVEAAAACGLELPFTQLVGILQAGGPLPLSEEALPLDTARLIVEYPEDIRMYGVSFNTTLGNYALAGEYAYRPNLPIQAHTVDLTFALLQPAFPANDLDLTVATLPGRRSALPDFLQTNFRGEETLPGQYVRGWEPMRIGQANFSVLRLLGAAENPFGASQMTILLEMGYTHLPGFPELSEFQSNGAGTDTHISAGSDGSIGLNPRDVRSNPDDPTSDNRTLQTAIQNPTSWFGVDRSGFGTKESYGYRLITLTRYDNAIFGANIELLNAVFHDIEGVGPGLGQNFVEGRKQFLSGIRWDYQNTFVGELRYTWFTGGGVRDALRDRDNLLLFLGYQF
jgi:hypothetical protein